MITTVQNSAKVPFRNLDVFDLAQTGLLYLGYSRGIDSWGSNSLIRINPLYAYEFSEYYIPQSSDTPVILGTKFFDRNVGYNGVTAPPGSNTVYIGTLPKGNIINSYSVFTIIPSANIGNLTLNYINQSYASVSGLNPNYTFNTTEYDYYLLNYNQTVLSAINILPLTTPQFIGSSSTNYIAYSLTNPNVYSTILNTGVLTQIINNQGQITLYGMTPGFTIPSNIQNAYFFILNNSNEIVLNNISFTSQGQDSFGNTLIELNLNGNTINVTSQPGYIQSLSIFNEQNSYNNINDSNVPEIPYNYLLSDYLRYSILDPIALFQVSVDDIWYTGLYNNNISPELYNSLGVQTDSIIDSNGNTITYAKTQNPNIAMSFGFTNLFINTSIGEYTLSEYQFTYRQVFLCWKPQSNLMQNFELPYGLASNLFQTSVYNYNLGSILWISNKQPLNRSYLTQDEVYKVVL